jgi:glyoxylase-like metal-dependent hydrolase (beta-lactamase superfamily II)
MATPFQLLDTDQVLTARVTVLTGDGNGKYPDGNSTIVVGSESIAIIDPSLSVHRRGGVPADRVLISHAHEDHVAGIGAVGAHCLHAHRADLEGVRSIDGLMEVYGLTGTQGSGWRHELETTFHVAAHPETVAFDDGDLFDLGGVSVRVLHLPGHTRGHCAFIIEPDGIAFVGDVDLSGFGPYYGDHWSDLDDFVGSIAVVRDVEAASYVTFHHKGVITGHDEFVRQLDAFGSVIGRRDERLVSRLGDAPASLATLVEEGLVYRPGSRPPMFGDSVERRSIELHLARLVRQGDVRSNADGSYEAVR